MSKTSVKYIFGFALLVCVVCSFLLALVSEGLRERKEINVALDIKKNILKAVVLRTPVDPKAKQEELIKVYEEKISELVIDQDGNTIDGKTPYDIKEGESLFPLYIYKEGQEIISYCFPIVGKGLWSTLYGYLAIEPDAKSVRGITFYQHGETPGLGAEISTDWFQDNFKGKSIWDVTKEEVWPVKVIKGKVEGKLFGEEAKHAVDGISGATITSRGVTEMVDREIKKYEPFLKKIRD